MDDTTNKLLSLLAASGRNTTGSILDSTSHHSTVQQAQSNLALALSAALKNHSPPQAQSAENDSALTNLFRRAQQQQQQQNQQQQQRTSSTYKDFSVVQALPSGSENDESWKGADGQQQPPFPAKLYAILSNPEHEHIISWLSHGRAWKIHDMDKFAGQVLPLYYDLGTVPNNISTFLRLVKLWGFHQLSDGPDASAFYNELFLRGRPHLHRLMRMVDPNTPEPDVDEPNLYEFPPLPVKGAAKIPPPLLATVPAPFVPTTPVAQLPALLLPTPSPLTATTPQLQQAAVAAAAVKSPPPVSGLLLDLPDADTTASPASSAASSRRALPMSFLRPKKSQHTKRVEDMHLRMENELRAAKELHDRSIQHLRAATIIADSEREAATAETNKATPQSVTTAPMLPSMVTPLLKTPRTTTAGVGAPTLSLHELTATTGVSPVAPAIATTVSLPAIPAASALHPETPKTTATTKAANPKCKGAAASAVVSPEPAATPVRKPDDSPKKKKRRKWLPPLGPPPTAAVSAAAPSSSVYAASNCDWFYTNPEVFASLANASSGGGTNPR